MGGDPVPQALLITGIVVAFAATALAVALLLRLFEEHWFRHALGRCARPGARRCGRLVRSRSVPIQTLTTPGGLLLVLSVLIPFVGVLAGLALGGRNAQRVALATLPLGLGIAIAIADALAFDRATPWSICSAVGRRRSAWPYVRTRLSAVMLLAIAVVICGIAVYARCDFNTPPGANEARAPLTFWTLLLAVWGSLNLIFVSADLFTLYVALELLTFAAVPLGMPRRPRRNATLGPAVSSVRAVGLRASTCWGPCCCMAAMARWTSRCWPRGFAPSRWRGLAAALMTAGLLAKTALFPLHLWLPPAHAGAPAAASAMLSALVIKGSWFLVVRLWFDVMPGLAGVTGTQLIAGAWCGGDRVRQRRRTATAAAEAPHRISRRSRRLVTSF